ncbi:hypothetical protein Ntsu_80410 [Nocardia sp. IFM 10818]
MGTGVPQQRDRPPLRDRLGKLWTPSHARLSVLTQYATRGASLNDIRTTEGDPDWAGFWVGYIDRKDRAHRLQKDWTRAYAQAEKRLAAIAEKSSHPDHRTEQVHTGA